MNDFKPLAVAIPDVQSRSDHRHIAIDWVGIKAIRHPLLIADRDNTAQHTIASCNLYVSLPKEQRGTHMSRFVELLQQHPLGNREPLKVDNLQQMVREMTQKLGAQSGRIEFTFPFFVQKAAPMSGVFSLLDYAVTLTGTIKEGSFNLLEQVTVPVTSLCPSSKEVADYGAHNQRAHITVEIACSEPIWLIDLLQLIEAQGSAELYGLLKRVDEKQVTEQAYDNPKFVEDLVRDVGLALSQHPYVVAYTVQAENFESIHNHSAYARLSGVKP